MNIQDEKLKYIYATTIFTTFVAGIFFYNYYSLTKKKKEDEINKEKNNFKNLIEGKDDILTLNKNIDNVFQNVTDFKITPNSENVSILNTAIEDEDPPTDLDGVSSFREDLQIFEKNKRKSQSKEKPKSKKNAPSKGIYGNTAIKKDDPIRKLLIENVNN